MTPTSVYDLDFTPVGDVFPSPREWRDEILYEVMIDRFDNGADAPLFDREASPRGDWNEEAGKAFLGGTLRGITRRLDYIRGLGCTTVWITPPMKNRVEHPHSYHGYAIQDFLAVDPRFGTLEDLQELVREAHARQMYVVLDVVINHTGDNWAYPNDGEPEYRHEGKYELSAWRRGDGSLVAPGTPLERDDGVWPVEFQNPDFYNRQGRIHENAPDIIEHIQGDMHALKDLDLHRADVLDALIRCFKWWIAQTDCDGFRLDAVKNTPAKPTAIFVNAIREYALSIGKHNFMMFAEIVDTDESLMKYVGRNTPVENEDVEYPKLTACLDYPLHADIEEVLKGEHDPQNMIARYERFQHHYRDFGRVGEYFVTFLDNHDQPYRKYRRFMHGNDDRQLAVLGTGYLLTSMGIPCVYYGTEQCLDGGGPADHYVRETMFGSSWGGLGTTEAHLFDDQYPAYQQIAHIAKLRQAEPALLYGRQYFRQVSADGTAFDLPRQPGGLLAYSRVLDVMSLLVVLNVDTQPRTAWVAVDENLHPAGAKLRDKLSDRAVKIEKTPAGILAARVELPARGLAVFANASD